MNSKISFTAKLNTARFVLMFLLTVIMCSVYAQEALFRGEKYSFDVFFDKRTNPGDAFFISMMFHFTDTNQQTDTEAVTPQNSAAVSTGGTDLPTFETAPKNDTEHLLDAPSAQASPQLKNQPSISASCTLTKNGSTQKTASAEFYSMSHILMTGFPIPLNTSPGDYTLEVIYTVAELHKMMFTLPVTVKEKEFASENIPLDGAATAIKKDNGPERTAQIQHIQNIFNTVDTFAFYHQGPFIEPLPAGTVRSAGFGDKRTYLYSDGTSEKAVHYGIDYDVPIGTPVVSCGGGKVIMAENRISTGWTIGIEHLPGLYSFYYHLDSIALAKGDIIAGGVLVEKSGSTGMITGPHLHWEVRFKTEPVNPDYFVKTYARYWK